MSQTTFALPVASFHVFGSGSASCRLERKNNIRVRGVNPIEKNNGFVGFVMETVTLYDKTRVRYVKGAFPGGTTAFEGTWEDLVSMLRSRS
jgi:hypothetical protein